ncbi:MAG TPA: S8 family serine peptidase, partial [Xanthomonadales bacterium]|nr:S8 family serine peptidase [Xanthomonadales bacterium]
NNDSDPNDDNGHGTHVAGILGATGNNGNKIPGANWRVKIMAIKVLNNTGSGSLDNISKGLRYAADNGAKISNISIGCNCTSQIFNDTVNYAHDRGMTVVAAAGNDNRDVSTNAIANATWAITVGATDPYDQKASFSNFGPKIDVVAPGINILSIVSNVSPMCGVTSGGYNYVCWHNGTSFAAPHVAGLAALMLSKKPSLTHEDIRQILRSTAQDLGTVGRDTTFGSGRIDAGRAMAQVAGTSGSNPTPLPPQPTTAPTNPPTSSIPQSFTTASLIAAVNGCGSAYVKAGDISGPWYQQTKCSDAKVADASGSWVTVINGAGGLFVKRNSASGFSQVLNNGDAKAVAISNNRLGIINGCGAFYVKEGDLASTAGRVLQTNCGDTKAMDVSDSWIAVINSASELWVKRGITGAFTKILNAGDAQAVSVSNNRIGVITGCGASYVREGDLATASWQLQTNCGDAKSIDVSDNRVAVINGCGALYAKDGALSGGFRLLLNCGDAKAVSVSNGLIAATNNSGALYYRKSLSDGWSLLLNPGDVSNFKVAK